MNEVMVFSNPQFGSVRTAGNSDYPLFCLADICRVLELSPSKVAQRLQDDVLSKYPILDALNREQLANFVNEDGLYDVILDSRKPEAKAFRKWITSEVLPSIRRNGAYMTDAAIESIIADPENGIRLLMALKDERRMRRLAEERAAYLEKVCMEQQPKAAVADTIPIEGLASILRQNGVDTGKHRLYRWMRENGYLGTHGQGRNIPKRQYVEEGLFIVNTSTYPVGGEICSRTVALVTRKGMQFFMDKFIDNNQNEVKL